MIVGAAALWFGIVLLAPTQVPRVPAVERRAFLLGCPAFGAIVTATGAIAIRSDVDGTVADPDIVVLEHPDNGGSNDWGTTTTPARIQPPLAP